MAIEEHLAETPRLRGGPAPEHLRLENLIAPEKIRELLHKTLDLSDEAFEDMVDDIGARAARLVLRAKAVSGDVKALDLYLRVVRESRASRSKKVVAVSAPENSAFVRRARVSTVTSDEQLDAVSACAGDVID